MLGQGDVVIPIGYDSDACRAASHSELALPAAEVTSDPRQPLAATGITKPARAANDRVLERSRIVPPVAVLLARCALEGLAKTDAGVRDGDDDDTAAQPLGPSIRLDHHPSAPPRMLDDVLADFRKRHREADRGFGIELQVAQHQLRLLLNATDDVVHVLTLPDGGDFDENVGVGSARADALRIDAVEIVQLFGLTKEAGPGPVGRGLLEVGDRERHPLRTRLRERQERHQAIRRRPAHVSRVDQNLRVCREWCQLPQNVLERLVIERGRNIDDGGHLRLNSPRRKLASPVAPRCSRFRDAA